MWVKVREYQPHGHWVEGVEKLPGEVFLLEQLPLTDEREERIPENLVARLQETEPPEGYPLEPAPLTLESVNARIDALIKDLSLRVSLPDPGVPATGIVRFSQVGAAGSAITLSITGIAAGEPPAATNPEGELETPAAPVIQHVYQEANAEDFANGVWTNGTSAATSAASFAAAINGDERDGGSGAAQVSALVIGDGTAVLLYAEAPGQSGMYQIATTDGNVDVSGMAFTRDASPGTCFMMSRTVTATDIEVGEVHLVVDGRPHWFGLALPSDDVGEIKTALPNGVFAYQQTPDRLVYTFGSGDQLGAGTRLNVLVQM